MAKIGYIVPGIGLADEEVDRRGRIANEILGGNSSVDIITVDNGPKHIENSVEDAYASTSYLPKIKKFENDYDSFVLGCFGDPGLRAARELISTPIVGAAQSSFHFTSQIADKYIIATPVKALIPQQRELSKMYGMTERLAAIVPVEIPIKKIVDDKEGTLKIIKKMLLEGIEKYDGEAVILGCMSMGYNLIDEPLTEDLGIPVVNPVKVSLKTAEMQTSLNLRHSNRSYPKANLGKLDHLLETTV